MTSEELMNPRYKVIADYPLSDFKVGEILEQNEEGEFFFYDEPRGYTIEMDDYPHLFKKLQWWEERKVEDMPEYVNYSGRVIKVDRYAVELCYYVDFEKFNDEGIAKMIHCIPATLEDYKAFKQQSKQ